MNDRFRFRIPITNKDGKFEKFVYFDLFNQPAITCRASDIFQNTEQCTGLKDKNGKPIYEGDIITHYHQVKRLVPVDDKQPLEVAHGRDEENGLPLVYRTQKTIKYKGIVSHDNILGTIIDLPHNFHWWKNEENGILPSVEVIGNIHENPELLEDK